MTSLIPFGDGELFAFPSPFNLAPCLSVLDNAEGNINLLSLNSSSSSESSLSSSDAKSRPRLREEGDFLLLGLESAA